MREHICLIARRSPADRKITAFSTWSLSKLADHLIEQMETAAISRGILRVGRVSRKSTTTWNASSDREFSTRMHRVLALYDTRPPAGGVICVDELGPLNPMPRAERRHRRRPPPAQHPRRAEDLLRPRPTDPIMD
ncbi:hypothetical protein [Streptomyces sp. NPDC000410]|uniref:hypothetical protein n=1 Tax=Streptomyces sp. NPDC000410 TaxID=3154254 RepID=UPI0033253212